jgi:flavin reductase (DIM6/NTAB) family NADH-FMN oxidoreductase RutF
MPSMSVDTDAFNAFTNGLDYPMFVVTTARDDERAGCLVGFSTQASIHPPRMLVCLSVENHTYRLACDAGLLAVHVLDPGQHDLAELFGGSTGDEVDKFARCEWHAGPGEVPLLDACPNRFVGRVGARLDVGDHEGFLLDPVHAEHGRDERELGFLRAKRIEPGHPA